MNIFYETLSIINSSLSDNLFLDKELFYGNIVDNL
jgi:hypothetical protein